MCGCGTIPQVFPGKTNSYGLSNFVGSFSAGEMTASWTRAYSGGALSEEAIGCCGRAFSHWVVTSGGCQSGCNTASPQFGYHASNKNWTSVANFDTCPSFDAVACSPTTAAPTVAAPAVSTAIFDIDAVCAGKGGLVLPAPDSNAFRVCWEPRGTPATSYRFYMQTTIGDAGYAAFGISSDNKMPGTEVYWLDPRDESAGGGMSMRYNSGYNPDSLCNPAASCNFLQSTIRTATNGVVQ